MEGIRNLEKCRAEHISRFTGVGKRIVAFLLIVILAMGQSLPVCAEEEGQDTEEAKIEEQEEAAEEALTHEGEKDFDESENRDTAEGHQIEQEISYENCEEVLGDSTEPEEELIENETDPYAEEGVEEEVAQEDVEEGEVESLVDGPNSTWLSDYEYEIQGEWIKSIKLTGYKGNETVITVLLMIS